jgi:hypothetical protein
MGRATGYKVSERILPIVQDSFQKPLPSVSLRVRVTIIVSEKRGRFSFKESTGRGVEILQQTIV